ncbi:MAG: SLC13 family permease [Bacteroidetes bacterium]|nr:SLC13 family permease [Bacteroidota bacterium]MBU1578071.1 SLC13 family permease [Bacteroidota bacterium]MBU2557258.1 SLC13 family permease [Bacteroidota bacterium]
MSRLKAGIAFVITPLVALFMIVYVELDAENPATTYTLAIALLMAVWWITEAIPLAVTSLLPVALFPLFGVMSGQDVAATYFNDVIFLFMGGFMVALSMQRWNLHKRIALHILQFTGIKPARILLGFMAASFFLSMWISNTATAMMMLPIALSVISQLEQQTPDNKRYPIALLLGVAYGASTGGMATLVGTPPNLSFSRIFHIYFPQAPEISFAGWLIFAFPLALLLLIISWIYLYLLFKPRKTGKQAQVAADTFSKALQQMGKSSREEKLVFVVFVLMALLWVFRADLQFGSFVIPGWSRLFSTPTYITDGTIAMLMAVILFLLPAPSIKGGRLLDWPTARQLPWRILLLFGGGFALASGFNVSGLSLWFGSQLAWVADYPVLYVIMGIAFLMTFLTELTSNTATTEMILPVLAGIAIQTEINPLLLMVPATLSASMAFMLPVATPPNAIIFGSSRISISTMARTGLVLNLIGVLLISLLMYYWGAIAFDINFNEFPEWALHR